MNRLLCVAAAALLALLPLSTPAQGIPCPGQPVAVTASNPQLVLPICTAAAAAFEFLAGLELAPQRVVRIEVVEQPLESLGHPVFGRFDQHSERIEVMSLAAIRTRLSSPSMYGEPFDAVHYQGLIAHEVTHAVVQHNQRVERMSHSAQEYLAHATQLAVLPKSRRERIIQAAGVGPWEADDVISDIYMALAINRFAVKCYLHLTGSAMPAQFVRILLSSNWRYVVAR